MKMIKTPIKRQTLSSWIEKQDSMLSTKKKNTTTYVKYKKNQIKCKKR